tara:strand:- start:223 stop:489 length:267 start_codon:yes stop_codon:yes gene_type:complete
MRKHIKSLSEYLYEDRDKSKDDRLFDCSAQHEISYVINQYPEKERARVRKLIELKCEKNGFYHSTHLKVYKTIESELGLDIPVEKPKG